MCNLLEEICVEPRLAGEYTSEPFPRGLLAGRSWHHQFPVPFEETIAKVKLPPSFYLLSQDVAAALENGGVALKKPSPDLYRLRSVGDAVKYIPVDAEEWHRWITQC